MTKPRLVTFALVLAFVFPGAASAATVQISVRDETLTSEPRARAGELHALPARKAPSRFNLIGLHWRGSGHVEFRTATTRGPWSAWRGAQPEAEDGPDRGSDEAARLRRWRVGNPYWTDAARRIQYRLSGEVTRLRAFFLWSEVRDAERFASAARAASPPIISRRRWGANESIVRAAPSYARRLALSVVHHTAGASPSTRAESAAMVRAIQAYHVRGNRWNDIGYNFLVDRFGQIFEGRGGGVTRNVIGAHAKGFNTGSVGVAVIGHYEASRVSRNATAALRSLLAWRLDVAHVDPLARVRLRTTGNERFRPGARVVLAAVSGHRDTGYTACPGKELYGQLPRLARGVAATGLPKLYDPAVSVSPGTVRFRARLSAARAWAVSVLDGRGDPVARRAGRGRIIDWTWDSSAAAAGRYSYTIGAGLAVRPARGWVRTRAPRTSP